jgi:dihydrofolate reductase
MRLAAVIAMDLGHVIGRENALPWHLPADLKRFRRLTTGHPVLMGRRTHESIGRPLPNRLNIVVSRSLTRPPAGCLLVRSLDEGLVVASEQLPGCDEAMLIGGAQLFSDALPRLERIYLTIVGGFFAGDVRLPPLDPAQWQESGTREELPADEQHAVPQRFVVLERVRPPPGGQSARPASWLDWPEVQRLSSAP